MKRFSLVTLILATLGTGLMAGLALTYAVAVMPGLANSGDRTFVDAFQQIDQALDSTIWFWVAIFVGSMLAIVLSTVFMFKLDERSIFIWLILVALLYGATIAITAFGLGPSHVKMAKRSGHLKVWGKRGKYREAPLNATAREALSEWMAELPEEASCPFPSRKSEKNGNGERELRPITDRALGYVVAKYAALAKVEAVSPQDLRHRFGYEMAKRVPLHRLARITGHDSLDTTMIYVKGTPGDLQQAVEEVAWTSAWA